MHMYVSLQSRTCIEIGLSQMETRLAEKRRVSGQETYTNNTNHAIFTLKERLRAPSASSLQEIAVFVHGGKVQTQISDSFHVIVHHPD